MHKNENRPGYKKTKVGWIPEGWKCSALGKDDHFLTSGSRGWSQYYSDSGALFVRITNLQRGEVTLDYSDCKFVALDGNRSEGTRTRLNAGDILISITADLGSIGYFDASEQFPEAYVNQHIAMLRFLDDGRCSKYIAYYLTGLEAKKEFLRITDQGAKAGLNLPTIRSFPTPLPSLPEQEAIAGVLKCWDRGIRNLELKIGKKRLIKKGLMQQLLSGKRRLPGFSKDWKTVRLGDECELITKGTTPTSIGRSFKNKGVNFVKIESLTTDGKIIRDKVAFIDEETHAALKRSQLKAEDILISIAGALGRIALVKNEIIPANINQALAIVRLKTDSVLDLSFLLWFLKGRAIENHINAINVQAAQANLSLKDIGNFAISSPPVEEQLGIAEVLSAADREIEVLERKLALWRDQKKYLLNNLVTGTIRLPQFRKVF
ncbi:MAG: restriction endonuclease subunit S [Pontiellaceae bacterium]|nr:restriction endonuclease subunit S [Pontiellaceae bacterium]